MVDQILKIARPGDFDVSCINWNTEIIVFIKKCHLNPKFIVTPCRINVCRINTIIYTKSFRSQGVYFFRCLTFFNVTDGVNTSRYVLDPLV